MSQLSERDTYVYLAKLAEQCERYDEMKENMKRVVTQNEELTIEERNLLSVAYKNVIGSRRASWRIISSQVPKDEKKDCMVQDAKEYKEVIEKELKEICNDILSLLSTNLIPTATTAESKVFYNKMKGDYYRYLAEFTSESEKTQMAQESLQAYREAQTTAEVLPFTHPIRLGLALNFSVFFYEILVRREEACKLAKDSFEAAIKDLKDIDQDNYKDSTLILQLLRDNLTLWTSEVPDDVEQSQAQVEQIHVQDLEKED